MLLFLFSLFFAVPLCAQKIVYSEPERDDSRRLNFEIAGKVGGNFLIYKNIRGKSFISVLDNDMVQVARVEQEYIPKNDRVINVDVFPYGDFVYLVYQYQKKNIVYCMAAKVDGNGNKIGDVVQLDTTQIGFAASNQIYTVLSSEDKSKIIVFKINTKNRKNYKITTSLFDDNLTLLKQSRLSMPMEDRNDDFLDQFHLDNDGDLIFIKGNRVNNENIGSAAFVLKYAMADSFSMNPLNLEKTYLDEIHIKPDNYNKRYLLTSFYYKTRRGNTDGYYFYIWDKTTNQPILEDTLTFPDELRREARGNSTVRMAFNDYFIRNIITRRDGGFLIGSEAFYTVTRGSTWNRWNYLYSPYLRPGDFYSYSPYYNSYYWRSYRWNDRQSVRYQADNIMLMSFDKNGKPEWTNVIAKEQFEDYTDDMLSYQVMNTGGQLHILFNNMERRVQLLNDYSITPDGKINRSPTLKNLDKGYEFMPKYAKQVSSRQIIVPCVYRNYICFAKIEFN